MEVIAKRKGGLFALYLFPCLIGLGSLAVGIIRDIVVLVVAALIIVGISAFVCVRICKTPKEIIKFDGENLIFSDGIYPAYKLANIRYICASARGTLYRWGELIVSIDGKEYSYNYVADVEKVHDRLMELKTNGK